MTTERLRELDRLVGSWDVKGQSDGWMTYEWMEGGFFLVQRGELTDDGGTFAFTQIIGCDRSPGEEPASEITGRLYTSRGDTLQYTSESDGNDLTIWMGPKGSPAYYKGRFSDDDNTLAGEWTWPGGGYKETMTRKK